ncbi:helix-turn-helix transcriptional regulator [Pseudonocardia cypriaca]|uniref:Helix-turn-helix protein n=1 Tax=Pseudonocardia cypriaca TaxID=882449 RepID=A0A543FWN5_9PSEU|nr:helix-turn-helix transcriptional regulator [Pseudonocardia cypriaca]TQM38256.1 helix-turn-helix protein [Pseudonocardia cypriaca]
MSTLGEFLRSRRAALTPDAAGLPDYGERRRVPGLRREELARLAGVSVGYYVRLEQDQSGGVSPAVLDALARALRLGDDERAHLHRLARPAAPSVRTDEPERLRPAVRTMIDALRVPAIVLGRRTDVLAWNRLGHALLAAALDVDAPGDERRRPNWSRLLFLDPHFRTLIVDWPGKARDTVADLRLLTGRFPDDRRLAELVGELSIASPEFAELWAAHPAHGCAHHTREYDHELVGRLTLTDELMALPDDGQRVAVFTAEPGSASHDALELLAQLTGPG